MTPTKKTIQRWMSRELEKEGITPSALARLLRATFLREPHHNNAIELVLEAYDKALGNHGVEVIRGNDWNGFWGDAALVYSNTGDTYAVTLTYNPVTERFAFQSYGDFVERNPRLFTS